MTKEVFQLKPEHRTVLKSIASHAEEDAFSFFYGKSAAGALEKACTVVPQQGKEGPMTIGICFEPSGLVTSVTILSSEEERGKKVAEESFLKQFKGKKMSDAFQVGSDVDGVSGATWSSKAVAEALRKSSFAFKTFVEVKK
ncbi:MAG: FMN-binding protein [Bdellovibrionales bacterium]|nr:FMN-binding protein [Bdellovibrionales bacterium]